MDDAAPIAIRKGYKFAVLAVAQSTAGPAPTPLFEDVKRRLAVSTALPAEALRTWQADIGRIHSDELANTKLFLWAVRKSKHPDILDSENRTLQRDVYRLYLALLIATPHFSNGRLTSMTGANADGVARVRALMSYNRAFRTAGATTARLTIERIKDAFALASALRIHSADPGNRMVRALRAFRQAHEASELDLRLHQFVRCIEAFIAPPSRGSAVHFANRAGMFTNGRTLSVLKELYDIRSAVEHLRGPSGGMAKKPRGGYRYRLIHRCIQAEALSRFLVHGYLSHRNLWPHFRDRDSVNVFWDLPDATRTALWPERISLINVNKSINRAEVVRVV